MVEKFIIGLVVWTQYHRVTDRQTRCRSKDRAVLCVARVTRSSADADNRRYAFSG